MGFPAQIDRTDVHFPDDDRITHFAAREFQIALRVMVVLCIVATAVLMVTFPFWGFIPATALCLAYLGLFITNTTEKRTREVRFEERAEEHRVTRARQTHPDAETPVEAALIAEDDEHFTHPRLLRRDSVIGIEILIGLGLASIALVIVGVVTNSLPWELVAIAGGLIVFYGLFIMAPVWLGWFTDEEELSRGTISNERARPQIHR